MAAKMIGQGATGVGTMKFVRRRAADGYYWYTVTPAFEAYSAAHIASYGIAGAEDGATGTYTAADPAETTPGDFLLIAAGGANLTQADVADSVVWTGDAGPQIVPTTEIVVAVLAGATAAPIAADVKKINATAVTGDGSLSTPWGP